MLTTPAIKYIQEGPLLLPLVCLNYKMSLIRMTLFGMIARYKLHIRDVLSRKFQKSGTRNRQRKIPEKPGNTGRYQETWKSGIIRKPDFSGNSVLVKRVIRDNQVNRIFRKFRNNLRLSENPAFPKDVILGSSVSDGNMYHVDRKQLGISTFLS